MRIISADGKTSIPYQSTGLKVNTFCDTDCDHCNIACVVPILAFSSKSNRNITMGEYKSRNRAKAVLQECTEAFSGLHPVTVYKFPEE